MKTVSSARRKRAVARRDADARGPGRPTRRGRAFVIRADGKSLISSHMHGSQQARARFGCRNLTAHRAPRALVGGPGMGLTLRATLDALGPGAQVVVAELVPAVVGWNRGPLAAHLLRDRRVRVAVGDVAALLRARPGDLAPRRGQRPVGLHPARQRGTLRRRRPRGRARRAGGLVRGIFGRSHGGAASVEGLRRHAAYRPHQRGQAAAPDADPPTAPRLPRLRRPRPAVEARRPRDLSVPANALSGSFWEGSVTARRRAATCARLQAQATAPRRIAAARSVTACLCASLSRVTFFT